MLSQLVENQGVPVIATMHIYPVLYIPRLGMKLLSMESFLVNNNHEVHGNRFHVTFHDAKLHKPLLSTYLQNPRDTIYWVVPQPFNEVSHAFICKVDYNIWHKRLGHPSKDVLKHAKKLKDFPRDLVFPEHSLLCRGCAEGKMHSKSFLESNSQVSKLFAIVYSDLKEFPVESYSRFKYLVSFIDDHSSHTWIALLHKKSKTQFKADIQMLMSDFWREHKLKDFEKFLKDNGIQSHTSVPHMHQQNGCAERFNRIIMDKVQAMCLDACLPPFWWEFVVNTAVHLYNRIPVCCLE